MKRYLVIGSAVLALGVSACSSSDTTSTTTGGTTTDAGSTTDGSATSDTGASTADAGTTDTGAGGTDTQQPPPPPPQDCDPKCTDSQFCDFAQKPAKCVDIKCKIPTDWPKDAVRLNTVAIGKKDDGCDIVDMTGKLAQDGKPDNSLAIAAALANSSLQDALDKGSLNLLMSATGFNRDAKEFPVALYLAETDTAAGACDLKDKAKGCSWQVYKQSFDLKSADATCPAQVEMKNTKVDAKAAMTAGGPSQVFNVSISLMGLALNLKVDGAQFSGTVNESGTNMSSITGGKICGYITEKALKDAIAAIPADSLPAGGIDQYLSIIQPDVDSDGDGKKDSRSIALKFEAGVAKITGVMAK